MREPTTDKDLMKAMAYAVEIWLYIHNIPVWVWVDLLLNFHLVYIN